MEHSSNASTQEYAADNTSSVEKIAEMINMRVEAGWEFVQLAGGTSNMATGRWVLVFRKPKS